MPIPVIIDTDPGVDDMLAILFALGSSELDVRAITTTFGNVAVGTTTRNARQVLALAGRTDIPVGVGAARPLVHIAPGTASDVHGADGMGGLAHELPEAAPHESSESAIELMARVIRDSTEPVAIAAIGPFTNVALLLAAHPELAKRISKIVVMGGAIRGGNTSPVAEFNIWCDPEAAHRVFTSGVPVTMVGLDSTRAVPVDETWLEELAAVGDVGRVASDVTRRVNDYYRALGRTTFVVHDAVAIAALIDPTLVPTMAASVSVECGNGPARGCTVVTEERERPHLATVAAGVGASAAEIRTLITTRIGSLG